MRHPKHLKMLQKIGSGFEEISLCDLCVLCVSVVVNAYQAITTETQRTQRLHRELLEEHNGPIHNCMS